MINQINTYVFYSNKKGFQTQVFMDDHSNNYSIQIKNSENRDCASLLQELLGFNPLVPGVH